MKGGPGFSRLLAPLVPLYLAGYWARRLWLRLFAPRPRSLPGALVVSVGNLSAGGTGKTPACLAVAAHFSGRGRRVFFLTRGFGRRGGRAPLLLSRGRGPLFPARRGGDEPWLLAAKAPGCGVVVDADRLRGGRRALAEGARVLVLDDGFQQRLRVKRDLDLLLLDSRAPGAGGLLPVGRLREPLSQGLDADALVFTRAAGRREALRALRSLPPGFRSKPWFWARSRAESLRPWPGPGRALAPSRLKGRKVAALSGLADPAQFEAQLAGLGARVLLSLRFPDHHWFRPSELEQACRRARLAGAEWLVSTEKDAARWEAGFRPALPAYLLSIRLQVEPAAAFSALLERAWKSGPGA